ncbi:hypothetical protein M9H77_14305 [Catharanthus roseus]|uniref:Uncharacterized protein n=1 Tax=Catharanthus roseus TaxID=4058 RepID=A0ACC0BMS4_CATRO|nr:hypothetical protein M9H77_14305 [Catharanthus roseus]
MKWTQAMDDTFVKAMLNQHYEGYRVEGSFTPIAYINMENPNTDKWRTKPINNYDSLEELFTKDRATGEGSMTAKEKCKRWAYEDVGKEAGGIDEIDMLVEQNEVTLKSFANTQRESDEEVKNGSQASKKTAQQQGKTKKVSTGEEVLKSALDNVAEALREGIL